MQNKRVSLKIQQNRKPQKNKTKKMMEDVYFYRNKQTDDVDFVNQTAVNIWKTAKQKQVATYLSLQSFSKII